MMSRPAAPYYAGCAAVTDRHSGSVNVTIGLKPDEFHALDAIARARNLSRAGVVRELILGLLAAHGGEK